MKSECALSRSKGKTIEKTHSVCIVSAKQETTRRRTPSIRKPMLDQLKNLLFRKSLYNSEARNFKLALKINHSGVNSNRRKRPITNKYANNK